MKKKSLTEELVFEDFQRAVVFLTLLKIKKNFKDASQYANSKHTDKAKYLHIDSKILKRLSRFGNAYYFTQFLEKSAHLFEFHKHVSWKYRSGKQFKINSWFELKFSIDDLDKALNSKLYMDLKSELYSKRVHKILDNLFNSKKKKESNTTKSDKEESNTTKAEEKKEDNMTKAEKKAVYKKYADGKGAFTTPEFEIKQIEKKERANAKRQLTRQKKAIKEVSKEFAELEAENKQLKAEIAKLKQLKDLNSDIPSENIENSELEKLKCDNTADQLAEEAVSELEGIAHKQQLHPDDDIPDVPPEPAHVKPPADDIPTVEEQKEDKTSLMSFMLQGLVNCRILQKTEAETLRANSIWKSEIPNIVDKLNVTLDDTQKHIIERYRVAKYIQKHMREFSLESWNENKYPKRWAESVFRDFGYMKKRVNKKSRV